MAEVPAYVVNGQYDLLAWNDVAARFFAGLIHHLDHDRNLLRWMLARATDDARWDMDAASGFLRAAVADLRTAHARQPEEAGMQELVTDLLSNSSRFAAIWQARDITVRRRIVKKFASREFGDLEFDCQLMHIAETGQRLISCCAEPGTPTHARFRRLAAAHTDLGRG
ncbi:hypothetical protein [Streptomyces sp. NPDC050264]|uniref:MmyB family transcriptional regulator n=1 Tax=Streptomyces sp. NPDC050264 TaxID=3155038 RepID=UPI003421BF51